ncbi:hypothetical protein ADIARSV_4249 [Arcticibacter svalbardensis MN12-7]|uniref:Uncharacterized protein n=1 Tax=Arcticibacter svalbardensis MN12-7 TaxID=1150600 RepID=R9GLN6_9SPHI|nr:hypothetical protein ADIARSV_4249 [Arcticibacter svalbardensis MN12-7]
MKEVCYLYAAFKSGQIMNSRVTGIREGIGFEVATAANNSIKTGSV